MNNSGSDAPTLGEMIATPSSIPAAPQSTPAPVAPTNSAEATARFNELQKDAGWRDRFLAGNGPEAREYRDLRTMIDTGVIDKVELAMAGIPDADIPSSGHRVMIGTAEFLRDHGFPPLAVRETLSGKEASQEDYDRAVNWKAQAMRSTEFTTRYLGGEPEARREMLAANIVINSGVKKAS
jgi:hypothetical protein